jgi:hypothetical protein
MNPLKPFRLRMMALQSNISKSPITHIFLFALKDMKKINPPFIRPIIIATQKIKGVF